LPLYHQIRTQLRDKIVEGEIGPGERLPNEVELAEELGVSRATVRRAIQSLVSEGLVSRRAGLGTFVGPPRLSYPLSALLGFSERAASEGRRPSSIVIEADTVVPGSVVQQRLSLGDGQALSIVRLRLIDDRPAALETLYLSHQRFPSLLDYDLSEASVYEVVEDAFGVRLGWGDFKLDALNLKSRDAELLEVPQGTAGLLMSGTVFGEDSTPTVYVSCLYRSDRCTFRVELPRIQTFSPKSSEGIPLAVSFRGNLNNHDMIGL
jgi:GntR family transcriptional regulator